MKKLLMKSAILFFADIVLFQKARDKIFGLICHISLQNNCITLIISCEHDFFYTIYFDLA